MSYIQENDKTKVDMILRLGIASASEEQGQTIYETNWLATKIESQNRFLNFVFHSTVNICTFFFHRRVGCCLFF